MTTEEIAGVLDLHRLWLARKAGGSRANLSGADLSGADLSGAYLSDADLSDADLHGANLHGADLHGADLREANLSGADLSGAYLSGADLSGAYLSDADLSDADLHGANLHGADLHGADLRGADLSGAYLSGAYLSGAYLSGAYLSDADLSRAKHVELPLARTEIVAREGEVIGWKQCRDGVLVKLRVPPGARRSNATGRKCRAEFVEVLEVVPKGKATVAVSLHDGKTEYRVGETVHCDKWEPNRLIECAGGIHFFLTREEAEDYC